MRRIFVGSNRGYMFESVRITYYTCAAANSDFSPNLLLYVGFSGDFFFAIGLSLYLNCDHAPV